MHGQTFALRAPLSVGANRVKWVETEGVPRQGGWVEAPEAPAGVGSRAGQRTMRFPPSTSFLAAASPSLPTSIEASIPAPFSKSGGGGASSCATLRTSYCSGFSGGPRPPSKAARRDPTASRYQSQLCKAKTTKVKGRLVTCTVKNILMSSPDAREGHQDGGKGFLVAQTSESLAATGRVALRATPPPESLLLRLLLLFRSGNRGCLAARERDDCCGQEHHLVPRMPATPSEQRAIPSRLYPADRRPPRHVLVCAIQGLAPYSAASGDINCV